MSSHCEAKQPVVRKAIGDYLKMAPYREGGAGKGACLNINEQLENGDNDY